MASVEQAIDEVFEGFERCGWVRRAPSGWVATELGMQSENRRVMHEEVQRRGLGGHVLLEMEARAVSTHIAAQILGIVLPWEQKYGTPIAINALELVVLQLWGRVRTAHLGYVRNQVLANRALLRKLEQQTCSEPIDLPPPADAV